MGAMPLASPPATLSWHNFSVRRTGFSYLATSPARCEFRCSGLLMGLSCADFNLGKTREARKLGKVVILAASIFPQRTAFLNLHVTSRWAVVLYSVYPGTHVVMKVKVMEVLL
ncbi:hypothetical protein MUK42_28659 [Musa troglodytarum]|uniref:Uncharacterized protein n=1 Tax=Musa troglodytarum TaxID=320322 RepID=A0A9E7GCJ4_9LILI|nr:hypothetical protein MUK42_28659 [Musa troglodytarum]